MTLDEVKLHLTGILSTVYTVTLDNSTTLHGLIEGPYKGSPSDKREYAREAFIYIATLSSGLSKNQPVLCSSIESIVVK
jgi:hypothetical protein